MSGNPLKLKVAYLYPDILHGLSDRANVETFKRRCNWRDIEVDIIEIYGNDKIHSSKYDFYYIGGSNLEGIDLANKSLLRNQNELKIASLASVPMLAVNIGYMLFGKTWQLNNKIKTNGINILDIDSIASKKMFYGNIIGHCDFIKEKNVVGFENHSILTYLNENVTHFLTLKKGHGNNGQDKTEGARVNNTIGTYIVSPILAQNPNLCDFLIAVALRVKYKCRVPLAKLYDDIEMYSHNYILEAK